MCQKREDATKQSVNTLPPRRFVNVFRQMFHTLVYGKRINDKHEASPITAKPLSSFRLLSI